MVYHHTETRLQDGGQRFFYFLDVVTTIVMMMMMIMVMTTMIIIRYKYAFNVVAKAFLFVLMW